MNAYGIWDEHVFFPGDALKTHIGKWFYKNSFDISK
jgi:hypothetical protein